MQPADSPAHLDLALDARVVHLIGGDEPESFVVSNKGSGDQPVIHTVEVDGHQVDALDHFRPRQYAYHTKLPAIGHVYPLFRELFGLMRDTHYARAPQDTTSLWMSHTVEDTASRFRLHEATGISYSTIHPTFDPTFRDYYLNLPRIGKMEVGSTALGWLKAVYWPPESLSAIARSRDSLYRKTVRTVQSLTYDGLRVELTFAPCKAEHTSDDWVKIVTIADHVRRMSASCGSTNNFK